MIFAFWPFAGLFLDFLCCFLVFAVGLDAGEEASRASCHWVRYMSRWVVSLSLPRLSPISSCRMAGISCQL